MSQPSCLQDEERKRFIGRTTTSRAVMNQQSMQAASMPNPALKPFSVLLGHWNTTGTHGLVPDTILHGRTSFEWLEGGAFLMMRSAIDDPRFPSGIAMIGSDDATEEYFMLYFDERTVSRKYGITAINNGAFEALEKARRISSPFPNIVTQRDLIMGKGEFSKDGSSWEKDLELTYTRVE